MLTNSHHYPTKKGITKAYPGLSEAPGGESVTKESMVKDLRVLMDDKLDFYMQIEYMVKKARKKWDGY